MAVEFSLTNAEHGRIIQQKLLRGDIEYTDLSIDEVYCLSFFTALELGTFEALGGNIHR